MLIFFGIVTIVGDIFVNVPVGIIALIVIAKFCPPIKHDTTHKPDYIGATFLTIALKQLVLAVDNTELVFKGLIDAGWAINNY